MEFKEISVDMNKLPKDVLDELCRRKGGGSMASALLSLMEDAVKTRKARQQLKQLEADFIRLSLQ